MNPNMMSYRCPSCGHTEEHYSERLAHQPPYYDPVITYFCPPCDRKDLQTVLVEDGRVVTGRLLNG